MSPTPGGRAPAGWEPTTPALPVVDRRPTAADRAADSVDRRLRHLLGVVLAGLVVVALASAVPGYYASEALDEIVDRDQPLRTANAELLTTVVDAETGMRGYALTRDRAFLEPYVGAVASLPTLTRRARDLAGDDRKVLDSIDAQAAAFTRWRTTFAEAVIDDVSRGGTGLALVRTGDGKAIIDEIRRFNAQTRGLIADLGVDQRSQVERARAVVGLSSLLVVVGGVIAGLAQSRRTRRAVVDPLLELGRTIDRLQAGDTAARATVSGVADVRTVAVAVNELADQAENSTRWHQARLDHERRLREVAQWIRSELDPKIAARMAGQAVGELSSADRVIVRPVSGQRVGRVQAEWAAPGVARMAHGTNARPHPALASLILEAFEVDRTIVFDDASSDPRLPPGALGEFTDVESGSVALTPVSADGEIVALIGLHRLGPPRPWDTEDLRTAEAIAAELGRSLRTGRLFASERDMVARLRELDRAKSDFVSSVSHELRTPLTSISGYVEILRDGEAGGVSESQDRALAIVERNTERLLSLIEDLLTLSKIESGSFTVAMRDLLLAPIVAGCTDAVGPLASSAGVEVVVDVPDSLPMIRGDAHEIERVALNLLTNAIKFSRAGQCVEVRGRQVGPDIVLEVSDYGIGMSHEDQDQLFTAFHRSTAARDAAIPGTGLGLVIAKGIVERHGGSISVRSALDAGTAVRVTFPVLVSAPVLVSTPALAGRP